MNKEGYSVNVHFDSRYPKKGTSLCPIQISVNLRGLQFKIGLKLYATQEEFDKAVSGKSCNHEIKELRRTINNHVQKAEMILNKLPDPTRELFQRMFKSEMGLSFTNKTDVALHFQLYIEALLEEERIGTARNYQCALSALKKYKSPLYFEDIDEAFLKGFKNWMLNKGNTVTSAQMYFRNLRAIFNTVIKQGFIAERCYPFKNFTIGTTRKSKKVLYPNQIQELWQYEPILRSERRAKAYFFFCYLCNGINFKDMACMKQSNVQTDTVVFIREKTKRTNTSEKEIRAFLHPVMQSIIEEWGNKSTDKDVYLFPVLNETYATAISKAKRIKKVKDDINDSLKDIGERLGLTVPLILNLARHSFGTALKLNGTPTSFITDALGHADGKTTEHYLKSIPDDTIRTISESLL